MTLNNTGHQTFGLSRRGYEFMGFRSGAAYPFRQFRLVANNVIVRAKRLNDFNPQKPRRHAASAIISLSKY
jgi:hypothetical protein